MSSNPPSQPQPKGGALRAFFTAGGHYVVAVAVIAAAAVLAALGKVDAGLAMSVIIGAGGTVIGGALGAKVPGQTG